MRKRKIIKQGLTSLSMAVLEGKLKLKQKDSKATNCDQRNWETLTSRFSLFFLFISLLSTCSSTCNSFFFFRRPKTFPMRNRQQEKHLSRVSRHFRCREYQSRGFAGLKIQSVGGETVPPSDSRGP